MNDLLANPAVQSAAAPFAVALLTALALMGVRLSGLAVSAGTMVCIWLALGLELTPLTATRRTVWILLGATAIGVVADLALRDRKLPSWPSALLAAVALGWMAYTALGHLALEAALPLGAGMAAVCAVMAWGFDRLHALPVKAGAATLATGLTVGGAAILGASASLGQVGLALGAAGGGFLLVAVFRSTPLAAGRTLTLPAGVICGLLVAAAVILAQLPWYVTPLLAAPPLLAGLPIANSWRPWTQAVAVGCVAVLPGLAAVLITWYAGAGSATSASGY